MLKINKQKGLGLALGAVLASAVLPLTAMAYGPERPTFTGEKPADYVTFNSITNNPKMGDERNFVRIREAGVGNYVDKIDIVPGKEYEVWTYFHNNASSVYNTRENNYKGVALDTKLKTILPATILKGKTERVVSEISAKNANPLKVWDEAYLTSSSRDVALRYIQGSTVVTSNGKINGRNLPAELMFGEGVHLGFDTLNGLLPGCTEYSGSVVYRFKADFADFEIQKQVSAHGKNAWGENYNAKNGENVDFKITYKNTGTITQENVNVSDMLPAGMTLVPGTTKITTPSNPAGKALSDNLIAASGINIGHYTMGASATVTFTAKIDASKLVCGVNNLTNAAQIKTKNGGKSDTAKVTVQKDCTPKENDEKCKVPGKGDLKKDDPNCVEKCKIPGKENLTSKDPNCFEKCKTPGKENLKSNDPNCVEKCPVKGKENLSKDDPNCVGKCNVPGKENLDAKDPNCFEKCTVKGYENLKKNDPNCVEIPSELPKTGPAEAAAMIIAVVAITGAAAYWIRSREEVKKATSAAMSKKVEAPKTDETVDKK